MSLAGGHDLMGDARSHNCACFAGAPHLQQAVQESVLIFLVLPGTAPASARSALGRRQRALARRGARRRGAALLAGASAAICRAEIALHCVPWAHLRAIVEQGRGQRRCAAGCRVLAPAT